MHFSNRVAGNRKDRPKRVDPFTTIHQEISELFDAYYWGRGNKKRRERTFKKKDEVLVKVPTMENGESVEVVLDDTVAAVKADPKKNRAKFGNKSN